MVGSETAGTLCAQGNGQQIFLCIIVVGAYEGSGKLVGVAVRTEVSLGTVDGTVSHTVVFVVVGREAGVLEPAAVIEEMLV